MDAFLSKLRPSANTETFLTKIADSFQPRPEAPQEPVLDPAELALRNEITDLLKEHSLDEIYEAIDATPTIKNKSHAKEIADELNNQPH